MTKETKGMINKYDIFISYSRVDLERVRTIKTELEGSTGALCWMDLEGIESGEQFEDVIISAINRSDTILFMLSECSMKSEWALDELDFAKRKRKRIVIIHLEEVELSDKFYFRYHKYDQIMWHNKPQREKLFRDIRRWTKNDLGMEVTQVTSISSQSNRHTTKGGEITPAKRDTPKVNTMPPKNQSPHNIEDLYQDGLWYFTTGHNNKKAIDYLERASIAGHVEAQNLLGLVLCEEKQYSQAMQWLKKAAEQGYSNAQYNLGKFYYKGCLGKVDYNSALKWFVDAASNRNDEANNMLGVMYEEGKGVAQNYNTAYEYYRIAANAGNVAAQYNIGCLIAQNKVTHYKLDRTDAIKWFDLAARQGDKDAETELKKLRK